ncbi:hypothetical protein PV396_06855 [Streptomyces sp. ME02-8801-2C]|uniref:hypothetical protein n=1 Tax=Streptomyces sp. ME02-8801-2C TaxID=3028680 RepID=UPI0029B55115|nr:hypothetical protein [Streptomyces sp. ME02-8801-2C]MDX3451677.1 hypothetical protein [Streptomyces sp. ME02-8801-2C]
MRTTLTPEFYQMFAVLLVAATAATCVVAAVADELLVRRLHTCRQAAIRRRRPRAGSSTGTPAQASVGGHSR